MDEMSITDRDERRRDAAQGSILGFWTSPVPATKYVLAESLRIQPVELVCSGIVT